ncbi:protein O-glucosyltransferase 2 [Tribolium castaneum]|nr:PREDICTED: KDEL motif-containing protein 1 [Tribolium castaneum]|eukprot:XP_969039.1 PREDICTED: KDEL motif-containing protein 1 [Tribolium castaneum]
MCKFIYFYFPFIVLFSHVRSELIVSAKLSKVWGPGLKPHIFTMPARYFFIQAVNSENQSISSDLGAIFDIHFEGVTKTQKPCRIWANSLNRKDGSYIIRYKLYEPCFSLKINILLNKEHVDKSPYEIPEPVYPDDCDCPVGDIAQFLEKWECGNTPRQILADLKPFQTVNWDKLRDKVIKKFDQPHSISLCRYVIKNNEIYRTCYGKYVGFKMFMDAILLSLSRKVNLPDLEFFINLGDWPLVTEKIETFPIFSWCGSTTSLDIVMPTYDITESTLENMGRVMLDMLSVQGNVKESWENRTGQAFWRGRDSNQHRLDLIDIARKHPDLFNVSLTNFFFFRDKQDVYGPKSEHVSFFSFFDYKYQLALDGTVAAYRFPYLLAGGSLVIKQESQYYEHFYNDLIPNTHYILMKRDLSDLVAKLQWSIQNDKEAQIIASNGQKFANENLLPQHIFCYHAHLLHQFGTRIESEVNILNNMEKVEQIKQQSYCDCKSKVKDEL